MGSVHKEKRKPTEAVRSVAFNPLPLCSCKEYRGSVHRARGLEYKQEHPIPPLSGGEDARETEETV